MKKVTIIFSLAAILMGCSKIEEINQPGHNGTLSDVETSGNVPEVLYASVADDKDDDQTRTYVDGNKVLWHKGDAISYYAGTNGNVKYVYNGADGASSAEFTVDGSPQYSYGYGEYHGYETEPDFSLGIYPYFEDQKASYLDGIYNVRATYPTEQTYAPNSYGKGANLMYAIGKDKNDSELFFRNACGYLVLQLYGSNTRINSIVLSALNPQVKIAGAVILTVNKADPKLDITTPTENSVTLDCSNGGKGVAIGEDADTATEFWFALPPMTITGGIRVTVTDNKGLTYTKETTKDIEITRNEIQPMKAFEIPKPAPSSKQLWYKTADNKIIDKETADYLLTLEPKFQIGETKYFNAKIVDHYFDERLGVCIIEFDEDLTTIKRHAFGWAYLTEVCLPNTVTTIEQSAFTKSSIQIITIPGSVTNIGSSAFNECTELWRIKFDASDNNSTLVFEDADPFKMSRLTDIYINRNISQTSQPTASNLGGMFSRMGHIVPEGNTVVTLGDRVTTIPNFMFRGLPFQEISIPNSVTSIGKGAFYDCTSLESITIPGNVTSIGDDAFDNCTALQSITFEPSANDPQTGKPIPLTMGYQTNITDQEGPFYDSPLTTVKLNRNISYTLHNNGSVDQLDEGLFSQRSNLTSVTLGSQVVEITPYMFAASGITSLTIPGSVTKIGNLAFDDCKSLSSVTFEGSSEVLHIGFQDHTSDKGPFYDSPLSYINLNRELVYDYNDLDAWDEGIFAYSYKDDKNLTTEVILGENVKTIHDYMFNKVRLRNVLIHANVTRIGSYSFEKCPILETITLEHTELPAKGEYAFTESGNEIGKRPTIRVPSSAYSKFYNSPQWSTYKGWLERY